MEPTLQHLWNCLAIDVVLAVFIIGFVAGSARHYQRPPRWALLLLLALVPLALGFITVWAGVFRYTGATVWLLNPQGLKQPDDLADALSVLAYMFVALGVVIIALAGLSQLDRHLRYR